MTMRLWLVIAVLAGFMGLAAFATPTASANGTIPGCNLTTTADANAVNFALACNQTGWFNILFGDGGNTHIKDGETRPHTYSCIDNIVDYTVELQTLDGTQILTKTVSAGCDNEDGQPDLAHKSYMPIITR